MLNFFLSFLLALGFYTHSLIQPQSTAAVTTTEQSSVVINFFYSYSCPHCAHEAPFVEELAQSNERVEFHAFEISQNRANAQLLAKLGEKLAVPVGGVPFTTVGTESFIGYQDEVTTGQQIQDRVEICLDEFSVDCQDQLAEFIAEIESEAEANKPEATPAPSPATSSADGASSAAPVNAIPSAEKSGEDTSVLEKEIKLPLIGQVKPKELSLPVLTFLVALLDGFNPCAMWALVFLISLLLGMKNRRRMWLLGSVFIFVSGLVYFLFLSAWLNLFLLLGLVFWVRLIVGLVALGAGVYCLYDFQTNKDAACKVTEPEKRKIIFTKLKSIVKKEHLLPALVGIILLALAVNTVELFCSAGLPAIYTQILALSELSTWQYYGYLAFYILIFILDDLFVFVTAMITLHMTGLGSKYARYSRLIGGILMLIIGLLLVFKPEWLMFA